MLSTLVCLGLLVTAGQASSNASDLVGTWSTKTRKVITGPVGDHDPLAVIVRVHSDYLQTFYDPVNDTLLEPSLTGYSYSFTSDGHYEEAYYRAIPNPADPACPKGIMQWQHGTYTVSSDNELKLTPIAVDGRQLLSEPCSYDVGIYTRYNETETFPGFKVYTDPYHGVKRLDLTSFDGSLLHPMYLVYKPPEMLPTSTLNPTVTETVSAKRKRDLFTTDEEREERVVGSPYGTLAVRKRTVEPASADRWWWFGVVLTSAGGVMMLTF
ncbi:hypothetical protein ASPZODRAFT_1290455 [Penicilliopsis zonata CBS 506.65]|uniref:Protein ROT1 n=1 Tax=Penicilliopsis zonata CBS 506.65 TaxID=1073090 RepID=A0A1L9S6A0_9EURO|nr:hypothetical protein ASPZODRAFT_1290455 [Penicilliopsis zonata CBS 506.65]OJJ42699.1 hypothetical protein ASPZODRAFT_1290455 [Penicilliopsis zonata CBS 506.65]